MTIFDKIRRIADSTARTIGKDLARLDSLEKGLGDKATRYVLDGTDPTVLSTIATRTSADVLQIAPTWAKDDSPVHGRRELLARQEPYDVALAARYAEVLQASSPSPPDSLAGSRHVPLPLRYVFSEAALGLRKHANRYPPKAIRLKSKGLVPERLLELAERLGGTPTDIIDLVFHTGSRWGTVDGGLYRAAAELTPLLREHTKAVAAAGTRISANGREQLLRELAAARLIELPVYLEFALDLAGDSSKAVRTASVAILSGLAANVVEDPAIERLGAGNANMRAGMVELLGSISSDTAIAALTARRETETTARVRSAIETVLATRAHVGDEEADSATRYRTIDGDWQDVPPRKSIPDAEAHLFSKADIDTLVQIIDKENARIKKANEESKKRGYNWKTPSIDTGIAAKIVAFLNKPKRKLNDSTRRNLSFISYGAGKDWGANALGKIPDKQALAISIAVDDGCSRALSLYSEGAFSRVIRRYLSSEDGDLRQLEALEIAAGTKYRFGYGTDGVERAAQPGDLLRSSVREMWDYLQTRFDEFPAANVWPYLAENLAVFDEAFGISPPGKVVLSRSPAIRLLTKLPTTPARYFRPLLDVATGETKSGREEARALLENAPDIDKHIEGLLGDSRQAVRAGAAEWLADRKTVAAVPAIRKRLQKEKSEVAKAALLTALDRLGEDLSDFLSPQTLEDEATKGLKKAKFDKLEWMALQHLPHVRFSDGHRLTNDILKWWLFLAVKLKQPGGNALFDIYMQQLEPGDAQSFSTWVLDSWVNYDTARPTEDDGNEYAKQYAQQRVDTLKTWYKGYTYEQAFADLKREKMSNYLHSGAATKGLLALAKCAPADLAASRVRNYLKQHGSRTSQASSLLELLAAKGDPVSLQVLIAAATRLKQKGVQAFAGTLVTRVADEHGWSMDELADRTIPSSGLDEHGILELPIGPDARMYTARLDASLALVLRNPDGKVVKNLPSGPDETTKASKKQLSTSKRELKQVVRMQSDRLYEALCAGRSWSQIDWRRDLYEHPVMRRLLERTVWVGLDAAGDAAGTFRPTAEGDFSDADDDDVDIETFAAFKLAYGAEMTEETARQWQQHIEDYEVDPLFVQFGRTLLSVPPAERDNTVITDREGWVSDTFTIRGTATKLGYERGEAMDGGYFNEYSKRFTGAEIIAVIEFSGNCLPEENVPAAVMTLSFQTYLSGQRRGGNVKLSEVPPVLLSECWNDYRAIAEKGAYAENWRSQMPWM